MDQLIEKSSYGLEKYLNSSSYPNIVVNPRLITLRYSPLVTHGPTDRAIIVWVGEIFEQF